MAGIAILGCGSIGRSIAEGILNSTGFLPENLYLTRRSPEKLADLALKGANTLTSNTEAVEKARYVILAVKPYKVQELIAEIKGNLTADHVLISVASEINLSAIKENLPEEVPCYRAMPNTASGIKESVTCICGDNVNPAENREVERIFESVGTTVIIEENLMEAATILGACGIAYALRFIRAMIQGGIQIGFDTQTATNIATQTVKGAAQLLQEKDTHPEAEIDKVTTPKGCTITGLNEMEHQGFSASLIKGINASFEKIEK